MPKPTPKQAVSLPGSRQTDASYLQRGSWRCPKADGHYWLIDQNGVGVCRHCGEKRNMATAFRDGLAGAWEPDEAELEKVKEKFG